MNKQELLEEIVKLDIEVSENYPHYDLVGKEVVLALIDQLEEPAKLVIPQFVVDWYEENLSGGYTNNRNKFSGNDVFRVIQDVLETSEGFKVFENYGIDKKIATWAEKNEGDFIHLIANCSYKDGYEVEKEKLYTVDLPPFYELIKRLDRNTYELKRYSDSGLGDYTNAFTEQEIKDYDKRFWAFAEEVTD